MTDKEKLVNGSEPQEESAPAVVGLLKVSNDLLDFSSFAKKPTKKACKPGEDCKDEDESKLSPRERAIRARRKENN